MFNILKGIAYFCLEILFTLLAPFVLMFAGVFLVVAGVRYEVEWLFTAGLVTGLLGAMVFGGIFIRNFWD